MAQATQLHCNARVCDFRTLYPISSLSACHFPGDRSSVFMKTTDGDFITPHSTGTGAARFPGTTSWSYSSSHCSPMPNRTNERVPFKVSEDQHHGREREAHGSSCVGKGSEWPGLVYMAVPAGRGYSVEPERGITYKTLTLGTCFSQLDSTSPSSTTSQSNATNCEHGFRVWEAFQSLSDANPRPGVILECCSFSSVFRKQILIQILSVIVSKRKVNFCYLE